MSTSTSVEHPAEADGENGEASPALSVGQPVRVKKAGKWISEWAEILSINSSSSSEGEGQYTYNVVVKPYVHVSTVPDGRGEIVEIAGASESGVNRSYYRLDSSWYVLKAKPFPDEVRENDDPEQIANYLGFVDRDRVLKGIVEDEKRRKSVVEVMVLRPPSTYGRNANGSEVEPIKIKVDLRDMSDVLEKMQTMKWTTTLAVAGTARVRETFFWHTKKSREAMRKNEEVLLKRINEALLRAAHVAENSVEHPLITKLYLNHEKIEQDPGNWFNHELQRLCIHACDKGIAFVALGIPEEYDEKAWKGTVAEAKKPSPDEDSEILPPEDPDDLPLRDSESLPPEYPEGQPEPAAMQPKLPTEDGTENESLRRQKLENLFDLVPGWSKDPVRWRKFVEDRVLAFLKGTDESRKKEILGWFHGLETTDNVDRRAKPEGEARVLVRQFKRRHFALQALKEVLLLLFSGVECRRRNLIDNKKERERFLRASTRFFENIAALPSETEGQTQKFFDANKELIRHIHARADDAPHYLSELMKAVRDAKRRSLRASEESMLADWKAWVSEGDARTKARKQRELLLKGRRAMAVTAKVLPADLDHTDDEALWQAWRQTVLNTDGSSLGYGYTLDTEFDAETETHRWQRPLWFWFLCLNPAIEDGDGPAEHLETGDGRLQRSTAEPEHLLLGALGPDGGVGAFAQRLRVALRQSIVRTTKELIRKNPATFENAKTMYNVVRSTEWRTLIRGDSDDGGRWREKNGYDVSLDGYLQRFAVLATSEDLVEMRSALENLFEASGLVEDIIGYVGGLRLFSDAWDPEVEIVGGHYHYQKVKTKATKQPWVGGSLLRTLMLADARQGAQLQKMLKLEGRKKSTRTNKGVMPIQGRTLGAPQDPHHAEGMMLQGRAPYEHEPQHEQALLGLENYYNPPATVLGIEQNAGEGRNELILYRGAGASR
eukprot:g13575.t1